MADPVGTMDGYELFRWLTVLKQRVEDNSPTNATFSASQVTSGIFDPARIPQLPFTRIDLSTSPRLLGRTSSGAGPAEQIQVAGGLQLANGILSMAGLPSGFVIGDLLYADSDHSLARLADVSAGSYLRAGGVATAPLWSTLKLPDTATAGSVVFASATDTYGEDNTKLFWDVANRFLGIGTNTPSFPLHVFSASNHAFITAETSNTARRAQLEVTNGSSNFTMAQYGTAYPGSYAGTLFASLSLIDSSGSHLMLSSDVGAFLFVNGTAETMRLTNVGKLGIGITSPGAILHLKAGTTAAATAPMKLTSGSLMTSAEAGAVEFLTDAYYGTITTGPARKQFLFTDGLITGLTGTLGVAHGGTGLASYAVGDLLYASASTTLSALADVAVGSYLRSGGVTTAPLWSTLILPNAVTSGSVVFASATNTYGQDNANLFFDDANNRLGVGTAVPLQRLQVGALGDTTSNAMRVTVDGGTAAANPVYSFFRAGVSDGFITYTTSGGTIKMLFGNDPSGYTATALLTASSVAFDLSNGRFGVGTTTPTAVMHLKAGTATANSAPLKFTAGTNLTAVEIGAMEFTDNGTTGHLYITLNQAGVLTRVQIV